MKKTTKTTKAPAPATKSIAPAPAPKPAIAPKVKEPAKVPTSASGPAVVAKPTGAKIVVTAKIDVGFGNALFIRGEGPGLSWSKGKRLECVSSTTWTTVLPAVEAPITFKLLLNDTVWSPDPNYAAAPGDTVTVTPVF